MSEHEHLEPNEETQSIETNDAIVPNVETGGIDVEALKREWSAEWQQLLQVDIRSLRDYSFPSIRFRSLEKSIRPYLNSLIVQIRRCGQDSICINDILRSLRDDRKFLANNDTQFLNTETYKLFPSRYWVTNAKDREQMRELLSFAIDFMKQYTDYILSLPKPALGSEAELLRPAKGTGEVDEAGLVQPVYPENKPTDGAK